MRPRGGEAAGPGAPPPGGGGGVGAGKPRRGLTRGRHLGRVGGPGCSGPFSLEVVGMVGYKSEWRTMSPALGCPTPALLLSVVFHLSVGTGGEEEGQVVDSRVSGHFCVDDGCLDQAFLLGENGS